MILIHHLTDFYSFPNCFYLQVDQLFSILAQSLKTEIRCIEDLFEIIRNSPITPKPSVEHLMFVNDWQGSISDCLTKKQLANHSFYNSFRIKKCEGKVLLQAKPLPQDSEWEPPTGIQLLKSDAEFPAAGATSFRVEDLNLGKALSSLRPYLAQMQPEERVKILESWEKLINELESLPRRKENLEKMKIEDLPRRTVRDNRNNVVEMDEPRAVPNLQGQIYPEDLEEGTFNHEVQKGMDVAVYTQSKRGRPWLGRVSEIDKKKGKFKLQWFSRRSRGNTYYAMMNTDGSPFVSEQDVCVVMLWEFSEKKTESSFEVSSYWLDKIAIEYEKHDDCYSD